MSILILVSQVLACRRQSRHASRDMIIISPSARTSERRPVPFRSATFPGVERANRSCWRNGRYRPRARGRFTTVASWRGCLARSARRQDLRIEGPRIQKVHRLPERTQAAFEIALNIHRADSTGPRLLRCHGWRIVTRRSLPATRAAFRHYVQTSAAEFSVSQESTSKPKGGWFSDLSPLPGFRQARPGAGHRL